MTLETQDLSKRNTGSTQFLNFSDALHHLRWGERVAQRSWQHGRFVQILYGRGSADLMLHTDRYTNPIPWHPSGKSILAEDWYVLGAHQ